ncbi:MAG: apolipoprotein N-acyltransferase [Acidobacteriota bacterium]
MRAIPLRLWALCFLSALLQILPFSLAGPVPEWRRFVCWVCLTPLLWALLSDRKDGKPLGPMQTALLAYVCGFCWYMGNCYWIYQTMHIYGGIPSVASAGILVLFSLYVGLYHALFGALIGLLRRGFSRQAALWVAPVAWVAVELARARVTGFPWDLLGYTQVDNLLLTRLAPWTGVVGLSLVVAAVNSLWLMRVTKAGAVSAYSGAIAAVLAVLALTAIRPMMAAEPTTASAVLLQENLMVGESTGPIESRDQLLRVFMELSLHPSYGAEQTPPALVAWPEAPAPFFDADAAFRQAVGAVAVKTKAPVIVNSITLGPKNEEGHYQTYNSADFFSADGKYAGRYDKMRLVPFGEYTPYKPLFFFAGHLLDDLMFIPGTSRRNFVADGKEYGVFICYESIFGNDIREFVSKGANALVNISDDGWYGDSSAPWEHLDMVRMRAIENHRWLLRATNTGVTAVIDPLGRVTAEMPRHVRGSLAVSFGYENDETFYTRHGDWLAWICAVVTAGMLALGYARPRFARQRAVH